MSRVLIVLLSVVVATHGYIYQFSLTTAFFPQYHQYDGRVVGTAPFGFTQQGHLSLNWTSWGPHWNASLNRYPDYFVDFQGHWRPRPSWSPQQVPPRLSLGLCATDECIHHGQIGDISKMLADGTLIHLYSWNASEPFVQEHHHSTPGSYLVLVWGDEGTSFSTDTLSSDLIVELSFLNLVLTNEDLEGGATHLDSGQRGVPELFAVMLSVWGFAIVMILMNQFMRRHVRTSNHVWYMMVLFCCRLGQLIWATTFWWTMRIEGGLAGSFVLWLTVGQVADFWLRLAWQIGATIVAVDAPMLSSSKPARTALVWMLLVGMVAMFVSVTFADLTWWLWGAMLLWTDIFLQLALSLSLIWIYRLDMLRGEEVGKQSKFANKNKYCYGVFSMTTLMPLTYGRLLLIADSFRAAPMWYRGEYLLHYVVVEVCHCLFGIWVLLMVTARVARDDLRAKAFKPLAQTSEMEEEDLDSIHLEVFREQEEVQTPSRLSRTSGADIVIVEGTNTADWDKVDL